MTPKQFKDRWESVTDDRLVVFPESSISDVRVPSEILNFLVKTGLPAGAAPFLDFGPPKSGTLERVSVVWHQPSTFDRYRIIGGNGSGDPVCLDEETDGEVVYLNHDNRFQRVIMASSVFALAECLVEFRDLITRAGGDTERVTRQEYDALLVRLRAIDSGSGGYWEQEIGCFHQPAERSWWQFWKR